MMNFNKLNDEANYYTDISKKTGVNNWDQNKFQKEMIEMVTGLNLTKEQFVGLLDSMVVNNAELDMVPSYNSSKNEFADFVNDKLAELEKGKSLIQ